MKLRDRITLAALTALVMTAGGEAWIWRSALHAARKALARLEEKQGERDRLGRQVPAPTAECEEAVRGRIEDVRRAEENLRAELETRGEVMADATPAKPIDAYFEIAAFIERTRAAAAQAKVAVRAGERFGFTAYASEGPRPNLVARVNRQRVEVQWLLESLFAAHPRALLAVQRENPSTAAMRTQRDRPLGDGAAQFVTMAAGDDAAGDIFELDPLLSIRKPGVVDTDAFRVEFTGRTPTLRILLNELGRLPRPVMVRSVEVEPVPMESRAPSAGDATAPAPVPLIASNLSHFTVIVEMLVLPSQGKSES